MKMQIFLYFIMAILLIGCVTPAKKPPEKLTAVEISDKKKGLCEEYLGRGRDYEGKGDPVEALKQYKIALTVDSENQEAIDGKDRLESSLRNAAEEHYQMGLKFQKEGKYGLARQQFLTALRFRPDYKKAAKILTSRKRFKIKRYIVHAIKPGESLSQVAKIYYGDYYKFPVIAKYNNITDATKVEVGDKIKVPEIEGVEFLEGKESIETEETEIADAALWKDEGKEEEVLPETEAGEEEAEPVEKAEVEIEDLEEEESEPVDQVAVYRNHGIDLFNKKKYQEAIVVFNKVLKENPEDSLAKEYSYKASFEEGMILFGKKDYLAAKDKFEACLGFKSDCRQCHTYMKESEDLYKEMHYSQGIQLFNKQLLLEAIKEWELVKIYDNNYKRVNYLIRKARTILKNIEGLKEDQGNKQN